MSDFEDNTAMYVDRNYVSCKRCGAKKLEWYVVPEKGWRLHENGKVHSCLTPPTPAPKRKRQGHTNRKEEI